MSGETEKQVSGWTVDTLKEYVQQDVAALRAEIATIKESITLARKELERRLDGLNELRGDVEKDRAQFVKTDVYGPAHEELRRQRATDAEKITIIQGDVKNNATDIAGMKNSLTWLTRLIVGALILGAIAFIFQKLGG